MTAHARLRAPKCSPMATKEDQLIAPPHGRLECYCSNRVSGNWLRSSGSHTVALAGPFEPVSKLPGGLLRQLAVTMKLALVTALPEDGRRSACQQTQVVYVF